MKKSSLYFGLGLIVTGLPSFAADRSGPPADGSAPFNALSGELVHEMAGFLDGAAQNDLALVNASCHAQLSWQKKFDRVVRAIQTAEVRVETHLRMMRFLTANEQLLEQPVPGMAITFGEALRQTQAHIGHAIYNAARAGNKATLAHFIQQGADPNWTIALHDSRTPLFIAMQSGEDQAVELLLELPGIDVNKPDSRGNAPLHVGAQSAAYTGESGLHALRLLIEDVRTEINITDAFGSTALFLTKNPQAVALLLKHALINLEVKVNQTSVAGDTAFHKAAYDGNTEVAQLFIEQKGFDIDHLDRRGRSALHVAAGNGQVDMMKFLLVHGSDVNLAADGEEKGENGATALHSAAMSSYSRPCDGTVEAIKVLLDAPGIDAHKKNLDGESAFRVVYRHWNSWHRASLDSSYQTMASDPRFNFVQLNEGN